MAGANEVNAVSAAVEALRKAMKDGGTAGSQAVMAC